MAEFEQVKRGPQAGRTIIRPQHLTEMKLARINGASWPELAEKYPYDRTTIMRAVNANLISPRAKNVHRKICFTPSQIEWIDKNGGVAFLRDLIDRERTK